jgi:colanic acid biosynthesis glycosyl transferase WcaI
MTSVAEHLATDFPVVVPSGMGGSAATASKSSGRPHVEIKNWIPAKATLAAGVSVPSRFYILLAIGRAVAIVSEASAEAAVTIREYDISLVPLPGDPAELAPTIKAAAASVRLEQRASARSWSRGNTVLQAMTSYRNLVHWLLESPV